MRHHRELKNLAKSLFLTVLTLLGSGAAFGGAREGEAFQQAVRLFHTKQYVRALPLLRELAAKGNRAAMYRLAYLYENGLGTPKDLEKALIWYKKAASEFAYTVTNENNATDLYAPVYSRRLAAQFSPESSREAGMATIAKVDTDTPETRSLLGEYTSGHFFGLTPYKANYFLPLGFAADAYRRQPSGYKSYALLDAIDPTTYSRQDRYGTYDKRMEVEFQFSLKKDLTYNLFGWSEYIVAAYTQRSFWQLYSASGPFRETNYMPELFLLLPSARSTDESYGLKMTKWGFIHQSNGQEGYRSRSWNRFYLEGLFQWSNLFLSLKTWYRIPERKKSKEYYQGYIDRNQNGIPDPQDRLVDPNAQSDRDDNPDILDYMGYGELSLSYLWNDHKLGALLRYNFGKGGAQHGAVQLDWSYPFFHSKSTFWYAKFFNGYGESLIDYNRNVTKASFGFSFSRDLFQ